MNIGFAENLRARGVRLSAERTIPLNWVNFRMHPCPHWPGVEMYRGMLREDLAPMPVVLCQDCFVILDGWHRTAAHWLEGRRYINVVLADAHWMNGKERCYVDKTNHIDEIRATLDADFVSGAYREQDLIEGPLSHIANELRQVYALWDREMPKMRLWEQARALAFLGFLGGKSILDVGTRESLVPIYLKSRGADVTCLDRYLESVVQNENIERVEGDARDLPFENDTFDHVLCTACIKHIPGWGDRTAVREMLRVVKPHGLVAISFDYGPTYEAYPSSVSGHRIYDARAVQTRLASQGEVVGPEDWSADWDAPQETWPIRSHAPSIWEQGYNLQVGFLLFRKRP